MSAFYQPTLSDCEMPPENDLAPAKAEVARAVSRSTIAWQPLLIGAASSALTTIAFTLVWDFQERSQGSLEKYKWAPLHDLNGMLMLMPVGFAVWTILPPGWFFWGGFIAALVKRTRSLLIFCAVGGITFGPFWPEHLVAMMGI